MNERKRRLIKWIGYPLFGVFSFFICLYITFPYDKLRQRIEGFAAASGEMDLAIGELGPSPILGLSAQQVTLVMKKKESSMALRSRSGEVEPSKPIRIKLDQVVVKSGFFALLSGALDISFDVDGLGGEIEGTYEDEKKEGWRVDAEVSKIKLEELALLSDAVGLPLAGQLSIKVDLDVLEHRWSNATGSIEIDCEDCSIGDGKAKLKVPGNPMLQMGVTIPKLRLGRLGGKIKIEKGVATLENITAQSPDIELAIEGSVNLRNPVGFSNAQAYLRFKISAELKKKNATFELLENALANAKRTDGFLGLRISGALKNLRFLPSKIGSGRGDSPSLPPSRRNSRLRGRTSSSEVQTTLEKKIAHHQPTRAPSVSSL